MSYYQYGQDILQDILWRAGEPNVLTGATSDYLTVAKQYIQRAYNDLLGYAPWPWALKHPPGVLSVLAKKTNTATIAQDATSVTLGTSIATSVAEWWLIVDSELIPYRIVAHTAGTTALTLDAAYQETAQTAGACTIFKDEYDLASDCHKIWTAWDRNNPTNTIMIVQRGELFDRNPSRYVTGSIVTEMAVIGDNLVRITPTPETNDITIEYNYTVKPASDLTFDEASGDTPLVPLVDRHVIADAALVLLMLDKNDQRAGETAQMVQNKLDMMFTTYCTQGKFRRYVKSGQGIWQ